MLGSASAPARRAITVGCALTALLGAPATATAAFGDRPLGPGQRGHDVRVLQSWLTPPGYGVAVDGEYGRQTRLAVAGWEAAQGLASDGRRLPRGGSPAAPADRVGRRAAGPGGRGARAHGDGQPGADLE